MSSLAPAGVSSFHWRGGGRRRAGGSASFTAGFGLGLPPASGVLVPREAFAKAPQRVPRLRPVRLDPWRRAPPREGRETRRRCGRGVGARAPASPAAGGPREEGARGGPAFPPEEAPGGHIAELSAAAAARLLSGGSGLAPPPLRSLTASRDAPAEPRLSQSAAGREGAAHFRGKPCSARSLPPARWPALPRRGAEVAARSCRAVWRRGPGLARLRDGLAHAWPSERRPGR